MEDTDGAKERRKDMVRIFSAMHPLSPLNANWWRKSVVGAWIYRYCACGGRLRKCHRNRMKRIFTNLKNCGIVRRGGVALCGTSAPAAARWDAPGAIVVPCGSAEEISVKKIVEAAAMRCGLSRSAIRLADTRQRCATLPAVCTASYTVAGRGAAVRRLWEVQIGKSLTSIVITGAFAHAGYIRWGVVAPPGYLSLVQERKNLEICGNFHALVVLCGIDARYDMR